MPPWQADGDYGDEFIGQPHLTSAELEILQRWSADGAMEGDPTQTSRHRRDGQQDGNWARQTWLCGRPATPCTRMARMCSAFSSFPLPVDGVEIRPWHGIQPRRTRASCITRTSGSIAPTRRGGSMRQIRPPATRACSRTLRRIRTDIFSGGRRARCRRCCPGDSPGGCSRTPISSSNCTCSRAGRQRTCSRRSAFYFGDDPPERTPAMLRLGRQNIDIPPGDKVLRRHRLVRRAGGCRGAGTCSRTRTTARRRWSASRACLMGRCAR